MKLTAKIVSIFFIGILIVSSIFAWIAIRWEERAFYEKANNQAKQMAVSLQEKIVLAWSEQGEEGIFRFVRQASEADQHWELKWFWMQPNSTTKEQMQPRRFCHYHGIVLDSERSGQLEISQNLEELKQNKRSAIQKILIFFAAQVVVSGLILMLFGIRFIGRPIRQLIEKTRAIGEGDLNTPLSLSGSDELGELALKLNTMCDELSASQNQVHEEAAARVEAVEQLRHADRLRTVGRLASGLAHELGTPLNVVAGRASLIHSGKLSAAEITESSKTIRKEADRMTGILRQLLDFARRSPPQTMATDLRKVVASTIELLGSLAEKSNVELQFSSPQEAFPIHVDPEQFRQVISNLVMNAVQSMSQGGVVAVELKKQIGEMKALSSMHKPSVRDQGTYYCLTVKDEGDGIAEENIEHLFEPFFTTKGVGEGTGLGLSIVYGIIKEHDGWIDVESVLGKETCFSVYIPAEVSS